MKVAINDILEGAEKLINQILINESAAQGHYLTGALDASLSADIIKNGKTDTLEGTAAYYSQFVNNGFPAESASMKQFPFVVNYWKLRGLSDNEAKRAAAATIRIWMKQGGMPTAASARFSQTGSRTNMIQNAFIGSKTEIDQYMKSALDFAVNEKFHETKSETI